MIPVTRSPEPPTFDERCRLQGNAWVTMKCLADQDYKRPRDYWSQFLPDLAQAFSHLCGYSAMWLAEDSGCVDHYLSVRKHSLRAYEWSNYRYAARLYNAAKGTLDEKILDPFEVGVDWFEIDLPSLQLLTTDQIPPEQRERAEFTLKKLHLRDDERVIRHRRSWYEQYEQGELTLEGLRRRAPLIARAVERQLNSDQE